MTAYFNDKTAQGFTPAELELMNFAVGVYAADDVRKRADEAARFRAAAQRRAADETQNTLNRCAGKRLQSRFTGESVTAFGGL